MPLPKRQHSRQRGRKRRTHDSLKAPNLHRCPQCQKSIISHRACPHCGYYKGQQVVTIKEKKVTPQPGKE